MQQKPADREPVSTVPTMTAMRRVWRADRCVRDSSAEVYLRWIRRFRVYNAQHQLDERAELTRDGAHRFITRYARRYHLDPRRLSSAHTAVYALSRVYQVMELNPPEWQAPRQPRPPATALLQAYAEHLVRYRGSPEVTVKKKLAHAEKLLDHLAHQGKRWYTMELLEIDAFLTECAGRYARSTTADIASNVRCFARFLLATGRISADLADAVIAPVQPKRERPPRALPWRDVQRLLQAVDTSSARGLRDHALLLMMSIYGFGAGEVIGLQLHDIDWNANTLNIVRPKTGAAFTLPLLPAVAEVLAHYLRYGRPPKAPTRHVFIQMKMPFDPLMTSSAVRHILIKHARVAGLDAAFLGSHVLRHSNAARHLEVGTRSRVLSDLLGHRDPESVSAYVSIDTESLREISLPVPI